jgi:hypothetical protein
VHRPYLREGKEKGKNREKIGKKLDKGGYGK